MDIRPCGSTATRRGPAEYFTGTVLQDPITDASATMRLQSQLVSFAPGARTAWHTHPLGQTLYVTSGSGLAQSAGQPVQVIRAGDVIWIPPGERHWHGASPTTSMTHIAIQEAVDGEYVVWFEQVSEADYQVPA